MTEQPIRKLITRKTLLTVHSDHSMPPRKGVDQLFNPSYIKMKHEHPGTAVDVLKSDINLLEREN